MRLNTISQLGAWLLTVSQSYVPDIRKSLVRTLTEDPALACATIGLNQIGWFGLAVGTGSPWPVVLACVDFALWVMRRHYRVRVTHDNRSSEVERAGQRLALLNLIWCGLIALETILLLGLDDPRAIVFAMMLSVGERGYTGTLYAGFPRLAYGCAIVSTTGFALGLLLSPFHELSAMLPFAFAMSFAFHFLNRRISAHLVEAVAAREDAYRQARVDPLTGLANRVQMNESLAALCAASITRRLTGKLLYIDLDGFKAINDRFSHAAGDAVLVEVGRRLCASTRVGDTVCRLGGDEFVVLMPETDDITLRYVAAEMVAAIARPIDGGAGTPLVVGASIGITEILPGASVPANILAEADAALYQAKRTGKGRYVMAS